MFHGREESVKSTNVARDKPMSTDSSTQAQTRRMAKWHRPFSSPGTACARPPQCVLTPRNVDGTRPSASSSVTMTLIKWSHQQHLVSKARIIIPHMQISGSQKPGGRSHTRPLVGRKGGVNLPGSRHLHTRLSFSLDERQ